MRELRGRVESEILKLKAWWALNAVGRTIAWPMTVARVEMGFFSHAIVAETQLASIEVRCQLTATDENKHLESQYRRGTQFICSGRLADVVHFPHQTVISLRDAKTTRADNTATRTARMPSGPMIRLPLRKSPWTRQDLAGSVGARSCSQRKANSKTGRGCWSRR